MARQKSPTAFRTIGEVASELGVSPHVLRFWETKFSQIKPQKRRGGHRYYRPSDVEAVAEIKSLLYDKGFTIKGAQSFLKDKAKGGESADTQTSLFESAASSASAPPEDVSSKLRGLDKGKVKAFVEELKDIRKLLTSEAA